MVTGAAGFIGSHLVDALLADGHTVTGLDDLSTGTWRNLRSASENANFRLVEGTILDHRLVEDLTGEADTVFHLAAAVGAFVIRDRTLESLHANIHGTENVIGAAHRAGARLLVASTSEIYGKNAKVGLREDDDRILGSPLLSRWTYSEAKAIDESIVHGYVQDHGIRAVIARLFNTVGPRQSARYGMVIPRFVSQALEGDPLTVFGTGKQVRCFCHVLDVVPALIRLVGCEPAIGRAVNLGSSEQVSIEQLAARVLATTGSDSTVTYTPYREAYGPGYEDMLSRVPDCTLAHELVGFQPRHTLDEILATVIEDRTRASAVTPG
jgi:UDP-glucose 4-epimerase